MLPDDAQGLVFANSSATLQLGLLPPANEEGYETPATVGVPFARIVGVGEK